MSSWAVRMASAAPAYLSWLDFPALTERYHAFALAPLGRLFVAR